LAVILALYNTGNEIGIVVGAILCFIASRIFHAKMCMVQNYLLQ